MKRDKNKPRPAGDRSTLVQIEKPIYGGAFLARVEGKAMFVPLTLPGEEARVRIVEEKRSYGAAEPETIVRAAENRIAPSCRHFGACGGCQYQHTDYDSQLEFKEAILRETLSRGGVQPPEKIDVISADPWGYRNRIRLAFDAAVEVGYRARRSHNLVPIAECPIAAPLLVTTALGASEIVHSMKPALRPTEISLFCNAEETALLVEVFTQGSDRFALEHFAEALMARIPQVKGVRVTEADRTGQMTRPVGECGDPLLNYRVAEIDYKVAHGAFFQVNRWMLDRFVSRVANGRSGTLAWDLFAGVGLFARQIASSFEEVIAVESAPDSVKTLGRNLEGTTGREIAIDVLAFLKSKSARSRPDLIIVDPPRAGLGGEITSLLAGIGAQTLVYVSCDPTTLARDLRVLIETGYAVSSITLADMFPQTFHVETVVELQRS